MNATWYQSLAYSAPVVISWIRSFRGAANSTTLLPGDPMTPPSGLVPSLFILEYVAFRARSGVGVLRKLMRAVSVWWPSGVGWSRQLTEDWIASRCADVVPGAALNAATLPH